FSQVSRPYNIVINNYELDGDTSAVDYTQENYQAYLAIDGGLLSDNPNTTKSFLFQISNVNPNYAFLEIAIIETSNGTSSGYVINKVSINGNTSINFLYTGVETSYSYAIPIGDIVDK